MVSVPGPQLGQAIPENLNGHVPACLITCHMLRLDPSTDNKGLLSKDL